MATDLIVPGNLIVNGKEITWSNEPPERSKFDLGTPMMPTDDTNYRPKFPFRIEGCDGYTGNLAQLLDQAVFSIAPALQDAVQGNESPMFKAMFKVGASNSSVIEMLRNIVWGQRVPNLQPDPQVPSAPRFACVIPSSGDRYKYLNFDPYKACLEKDAGSAFYFLGGSYIFLCPSFWTLRPAPVMPMCPAVLDNLWPYQVEMVACYMTYVLIHEMIHLYLGKNSLRTDTSPPETYPANNCVGLSARSSLLNPQNFQIYVASKISNVTMNARN